jgi:TfoX/Sxy family transcriptional regulator of competence genes
MAYDEGLLERCLDCLGAMGIAGVRDKNVFGMRGLMRGKKMFAAVGEAEIIVKLTSAEFERALENGVDRFMPGGETLGTWVVIQHEAVADDPELRDWLDAGLRGIG